MADGLTIMWEVIEGFIGDIAAALLDDTLIPILQALFGYFFTYIFVTLNNPTLTFMLILCVFMLVFYVKYVRGASS